MTATVEDLTEAMNIGRLHHITAVTANARGNVQFYTKVLGFCAFDTCGFNANRRVIQRDRRNQFRAILGCCAWSVRVLGRSLVGLSPATYKKFSHPLYPDRIPAFARMTKQ